MSGQRYEVEIKSLLGGEEGADRFRAKLKELGTATLTDSYTQLNHYFEGGDPKKLSEFLMPLLNKEEAAQMETISGAQKVSVRTREMNKKAYIVMKASVGSDTSENGIIRMELEAEAPGMSLDELDVEVLEAGYTYQAKWSRSREEYRMGDTTACLDKNAGYGYVAELEKVIDAPEAAENTKQELLSLMSSMGFAELPQDRLERMFSFYNNNWEDYYGTDKIFVIE